MGDENAKTTSSKRKWSPCTWRYAIEDSQADQLPHKARPWPRAECKEVRSNHDYAGSEPPDHHHRHRQTPANPNRQPPGYGLQHRAGTLLKKAQTQTQTQALVTRPQDPVISSNDDNDTRGSPPKKSSPDTTATTNRNPNKAAARGKTAKPSTSLKQLSTSEETDQHHGCHYSLSSDADSRSKREMSPTELYFCDICSGRTAKTEIPAV